MFIFLIALGRPLNKKKKKQEAKELGPFSLNI